MNICAKQECQLYELRNYNAIYSLNVSFVICSLFAGGQSAGQTDSIKFDPGDPTCHTRFPNGIDIKKKNELNLRLNYDILNCKCI